MATTLAEELKARLRAGFTACGFEEAVLDRVGVGQAADLRFGDYQSNAAMVLAKEAKQNPRALAEAVIEKTEVGDLAEHQRAIEDEEMMRGLWEERAIAEREYLDAVRELKVAAARENAAKEAIEAASKRFDLLEVRRNDLDVKAPFDGRVVFRHTELGEWLQEGDPVITLLSSGEVEAWLQLPERHAALLRQASPDSVELEFPGITAPIKADKLSLIPDVEGRSRSFQLIAHIPDPDNKLTPGTSVEASVPLGKPESRLVISADAVLLSYSGTYVFIPEKTGEGPPIAKRVPVEVLFERNGQAVLAPGELKAGDQVIVEGNERLFPSTPLDPKPWSETRENGPKSASPAE